MRPTLLSIGSLEFHAYASFLSLAFLTCTLLASRDGALLKKPVFVPPQGAIFALFGALFGARIYHILQYGTPADLWQFVFVWQSGLVYYGGLIGGVLGALIYLYFTKNIDLRIADCVAPYLAMGEGITRLGCFLNGCCWGKECDANLPWGVVFPKDTLVGAYAKQLEAGLIDSGADLPLPVHPTQLYMTAGLVLICLVLRWFLKRSPFTLSVALGYFFCYGILRFTVEMFRGDSAVSVYGITVSGAVSLGLIVFSSVLYLILEARANRRGGDGDGEEPAQAL
ncbi:MAG: prolipoprotein diacylglyceryl transferase [Candidatus Hydrogenedentes bacterium]|jgi:phosphatidylglycerol:prolipoprotein diacylglycerol transferase|nr:prolipoprotein diacylglyceryl transferase [Candidatus Hydrogenedentota bacterium]